MTIRSGLRPFLLALALCATACAAQAQWKWKDGSGQVQYSDRSPPAGVADKDILQRPPAAVTRVQAVGASAPLTPAASAAALGTDVSLEAKKKQADKQVADAEAAKKKVEDDKTAQARAVNCQSAQSYLRSLQDGQRIARSNDKGERIFIDDAERARETQRAQQTVSSDCR